MKVSGKFLIGLASAVVAMALGYMSNHWHQSVKHVPKLVALPAVSTDILRHTQDRLSNVRKLKNNAMTQLRHLSPDELLSEWESLLQNREVQPDGKWLERWKTLKSETRSYIDGGELGAMGRWEDPNARIRGSFFGVDKDPIGAIRRFDDLPNRIALLKLVAAGNFTSDWVTTADLYAKLSNVEPADQAVMLDIVVNSWIQDEGTEIASVWLTSQPAGMVTDLAARSVYVKSMGKDSTVLNIIQSPAIQAQAKAMVEAAKFAETLAGKE